MATVGSTTTSTSGTGTSGTGTTGAVAPKKKQDTADAFSNVNLDDFLTLMLAELQNQDPLNPMDNSQMLQQVTQLREIGATEKLTTTLDAMFQSQQLSTGGSLLGKRVRALADDNQNVEGTVSRVSVVTDPDDPKQRDVKLTVDGKSVTLQNVREIL